MSDYRTQTTLPVGIRNNNPGNIKYDGTSWQGMAGNDGTFVIFVDDTWGIRALAVDLTNKINNDGLNTITSIINAYEGGSSGNTDNNNIPAYIAAVAASTGIDANATLGTDANTLQLLVNAISEHENGQALSDQYITDADIATGVSMAQSPVGSAAQAAIVAITNDPSMGIAIVSGLIIIGWLISSAIKKKR